MTIPAKPRIAIVGPGFISEYHVNGLRAAGGAEIACLVGRDPVRTGARAAALGISRFETDLAAVLSEPGIDAAVIARHRSFPGNRPSTTLVLDALTPRALGALLALYEHRVFTSAAIWGLNAFDQWGVELGKALCNELLPRFDSGDMAGLDASTAGLLGRLTRAG